jgi:hypothetical protein
MCSGHHGAKMMLNRTLSEGAEGTLANSLGGMCILIKAWTRFLKIYGCRLKCGTWWLGWMLFPFSHCMGVFQSLTMQCSFVPLTEWCWEGRLVEREPAWLDAYELRLLSSLGWGASICRVLIFCLLKLNVVILQFVFVIPVFLRGHFACSSHPLV